VIAQQERDNSSAAHIYAQYLEPRAKLIQAWANYLGEIRRKHVEEKEERATSSDNLP